MFLFVTNGTEAAQKLIPEANCKPDFICHLEIAVFCDGSVHDNPEQRKRDTIERDNLRYSTSYTVLTLRHDENWQERLEYLASL